MNWFGLLIYLVDILDSLWSRPGVLQGPGHQGTAPLQQRGAAALLRSAGEGPEVLRTL